MSAEAELNAVKKLEANKFCANCDAFNKFGHGNVCEKFRTFVCGNCKSAHQSFSMRVKSVSMSNWSKEEVDALREENGGGNALAKRVWLGKWDEAQMRKPTDKDHVDYFKKFINRVYNDRAFYDDDPAAAKASLPRKDSGSSQRRASPAPAAANVNLLDFAAPAPTPAFDAFGSSSSAAAAVSTSPNSDGWGAFASAPAPASSSDGFGDFAAFSAAPPAAAAAPTQSFDPFGVSTQAAAAPAQSFDPFGVNSAQTPAFVAAPAPVQPVSFDPFGGSGLLQPSSSSLATPQAPSSNGFGQFGAAAPVAAGKNFSAFDALSGPNLAFGGGGGMHQQQQHHHHHHQQQQQQYHQHGMTNGGGYHQPQQHQFHQQQQHMTNGGYGANAGANISAFMNPHASSGGGVGFVRQAPAGGSSSSRDPFAGLGLPHH